MQYSPIYGLYLPEDTDFFSKDHQNSNMGIIETELAARADITLTGTAAPTTGTAGSVGQLYLDTLAKVLYKCTAVNGGTYTWDFVESERVGDLVLTKRTSLGEKYLAANGATVSRLDYPYLASVITPGGWLNRSFGTVDSAGVKGYNYANGYYILSGYEASNACIWYTDNIQTGTWTKKEMWPTINSECNCKVVWSGTHFVTAVHDSTNSKTYIAYCDTLGGTWITDELTEATTASPSRFQFLNGMFICVCNNVIYYASNYVTGTAWSTGGNAQTSIGWDGTNYFTTYSGAVKYGNTLALGSSTSIPKSDLGMSSVAWTGTYYYITCQYDTGGFYGGQCYRGTSLEAFAEVSGISISTPTGNATLHYDSATNTIFMFWYYDTAIHLNYYNITTASGGGPSVTGVGVPSDLSQFEKNTRGEYVLGNLMTSTSLGANWSSTFSGDAITLPSILVVGANNFIRVKK